MTPPRHGGQLRHLAQAYNLDRTNILDFSANINPEGPPSSVLAALRHSLDDPSTLASYPDLELLELRTAIAAHLNRSVDPSHITVANGFVPLLEAAIRSSGLAHTLLPVPAFSEYRTTLERCAVRVTPCPLSQTDFAYNPDHLEHSLRTSGADSLLLANPQNPSGVLTPAATILTLARRNPHIHILLDEAFIDYAPQDSLTQPAAGLPNLTVFRSVTKFFAMPGLRVAYAIANTAVSKKLQAFLPPWPISTIAAKATIAALSDTAYTRTTLHLNHTRREALTTSLQPLGITSPPAAANFLLLRFPAPAAPIWERLLREHLILLRPCLNFEALPPHFLRTAIRTEHENTRLLAALAALL